MNFFKLLKPAPFLEEIQQPEVIHKKYKYWRIRIFYGMYIGYAFFYFTRKSFTFAMPAMLNDGFTLVQLGLLGSVLSFTYGISKFVSGIMGDRSNPRYFMAFGLILTGISNICFGLSSAWFLLFLFWGINAWFQGWGWPSCAKLLTHWYSQSERGTWWSVWNTSHNFGGALIPILIAFCVDCYGWRFAMFVPGILCILAGLFIMNRLRDIPQSLGLPPIEKFKKEKMKQDENANLEKNRSNSVLSVKEILFGQVLCNKYIWIMAFSYFFIYVIRIGFNDWYMVYLVKSRGYSNMAAATCLLSFEIGGFIGSLLAGWGSDKFFAGKRNPINVLFTFGAIGTLIFTYLNSFNWMFLEGFIAFFMGLFIFGPQILIGIVTAELVNKKAAATSSGFAGCFAYFGSAIAGAPLGLLIQSWGWPAFFILLIGCGVIATLLMFPLWSIKRAPQSNTD